MRKPPLHCTDNGQPGGPCSPFSFWRGRRRYDLLLPPSFFCRWKDEIR
nr:MAG TPA: hypothetical protein [Caudoviricetes sp.]